MASPITFEINGLDELQAKLKNLSVDAQGKGGKFALRKAAELIKGKAIENANAIDDPETKQSIQKNIAVRFSSRLFKRTGDIGYRVGIMGGAGGNKKGIELSGNAGGDTRHWRYIEFGTSKMQAKPFFRKSLEENTQAATNEFVVQYKKNIDRAIKRSFKKVR